MAKKKRRKSITTLHTSPDDTWNEPEIVVADFLQLCDAVTAALQKIPLAVYRHRFDSYDRMAKVTADIRERVATARQKPTKAQNEMLKNWLNQILPETGKTP